MSVDSARARRLARSLVLAVQVATISSVANAFDGPRVIQVGPCNQNKAEKFDLYGRAGERIFLEFPSGDVVESASSTNERILVVRAMGAPTTGGANVSTAPNKVEIRPLFEVPAVQVLVKMRSSCSYVIDFHTTLER